MRIYRATEIGRIPQEWDVATIGEQTEKVGSGITPTGGNRVYKAFGRPFVRSQNVGWGILLLDDMVHIDEATHSTFPATEIHTGDVFLNITGASIGRSAIADERLRSGNVNQHVCIIRPNPSKLSSAFLNYFLLSKAGQKQVDSFQAGGNRQGLNFEQVRSIRLPLPPVGEQRSIAVALSDVDTLLAALERVIAKKRDLRQAAMQRLLTGQTRLPGFQGEWLERPLGDIGRWQGGGTPSMSVAAFWTDGTIPWASSGDVKTSRLSTTPNKVTEKAISGSSASIVPAGAILIVTRSGILRRYLPVAITDAPIAINQDIKALVLNDDVDAEYVFQAISASGPKILASCMKVGTTVESIDLTWLKRFAIRIPENVREQSAIAAILSDMDAELGALQQRRDKTRALKQAMMQELLTGKTRLLPPEGRRPCQSNPAPNG